MMKKTSNDNEDSTLRAPLLSVEETVATAVNNDSLTSNPVAVADVVLAPPPRNPPPQGRVRVVECVAPSALPAGYQLVVDTENGSLVVLVPDSGVNEGQRFSAVVLRRLDEGQPGENPHHIPTGHWRDGVFDCCNYGCCHPTCCLAFCCAPIALGQVMTRVGLDWTGSPAPLDSHNNRGRTSPFKVLLISYLVMYVFNKALLAVLWAPYQGHLDDVPDMSNLPTSVRVLSGVWQGATMAYALFVLFLTIRTRSHLRAKYSIQGTHSCCCNSGCEDFCCSWCCSPCVVSQMARHTADYRTYSAECCSETGLSPRAPIG